jgi:hypothetical protein
MGCELAPVLPAWGFTENPNSPYQYMGKTYVESVFGISQLKDMGFKVKMTGSVWMQGAMGILPPRTAGMTLQEIRTANLANQDLLGRGYPLLSESASVESKERMPEHSRWRGYPKYFSRLAVTNAYRYR